MISLCFRRVFATSCSALLALLALTPAVAQKPVDLGLVPAATKVSVRLYLAPDAVKVAALDQTLVDLQKAGSPTYHHWLTTAEFGTKFGPDAASLAQVRTFAEDQGLSVVGVSASGLRLTVSGTAVQMEAVFAPGLHAYQTGSVHAMSNTAVPTLPAKVVAVSGFDTLTPDVTVQLDDAVEANVSRVVALTSTACLEDVSAEAQAVFSFEAKQAAVQGITVLATGGCGGAASFPAALAEVTSVAVAPGFALLTASELRPSWQWAPGLPDDGLRHAPDLIVSDVNALTQTLLGIAASMPAAADGSPARLGNVSATLYAMAPIPTVFTQPDAVAAGTWEPATGLGLVNLNALATFYPRGSWTVYVSGSATNYAPTHGQSTTLISAVQDISGLGTGVVPTGTITFATSAGTTLGTATMVNGSASITTNALPGGSVEVIPTYSGDKNYAAGQGYGTYLSVQGEAAIVTATTPTSTPLGGNISVVVTVTSASGLGTPSGSVTVSPQGIKDMSTYTAKLSGSGGTATATVTVPASQAGGDVFLVNCVSADLSFTCYTPIRATAVVKQATSALSFTVSPNPPVTGTTTTFVGTVTGAAAPAPAPTGMVSFYDNGGLLGSATLVDGKATYTNSLLQSVIGTHPQTTVNPLATLHSFSASYSGDVNYQASTATAPGAITLTPTTTAVAVSPNPPVSGSTTTLTATVAYTTTGTAATGTVQFYEDATMIGTGTLSAAGVATFSSTTISGTTSHSFTASYLGDAVYAASQSTAVTTQANTATVSTTTTIAASATTVNTGSMVTLTATVTPASSMGTAASGTVSFTSSTQGLLGTATLSGTTATLSVALTTAGAQSISAAYSGDANYKASTTVTPVAVTVGTVITPIALAVTPSSGVMYSNPVTATVSLTGVSTTTGAGPAGSVVFTIAPTVATTPATLPITATVALTASTATTGFAAYAFPAPAPGAYTVSAACTGTNFTCTTTAPTASLTTTKGSTITTVTATPAALLAGQTTTLTATIAPGSPLATLANFTGTVTFYNAGAVALGMGTVSGNQATLTAAFTSVTGNVITAVYSGDTDWAGSTSSSLTLLPAVSPTTTSISSNYGTAMQGNNIVFAVTVTTSATTQIPLPGTPSGTVTFYDVFNGQTIQLGTANLTATGPLVAIAQFSTTGLFYGIHNVTAVYAGNSLFGTSTSISRTVNITDYSVTFTPAQLTLTRGASGGTNVVIAGLSGFTGTVSLACTPPADTLTTCSFSSSTVTAGGSAALTIGTTAPHSRGTQQAGLRNAGLAASLALVFGFMLFPRKRRPAVLALVVLSALLGVAGCGQGADVTGGTTAGSGGSPLGTQSFTITTSGSDGTTTNRHTVQFQVTIQ